MVKVNKGIGLASLISGAIILNTGGCEMYQPPNLGSSSISVGSAEHINFSIQKSIGREADESAIIQTFVERVGKKREIGDVYFETGKLTSGSFYSCWNRFENKESAIICNGLGTSSLEVAKMGRIMSKEGINLYAIDRTGSGLNAYQKPEIGTWLQDVREVADISKTWTNEKPTIIGQCFSTGLVAKSVKENPQSFSKAIYLTPAISLNYGVDPLQILKIGIGDAIGFDCPQENPVPIEAYTEREEGRDFLRNDPLFSHRPGSSSMILGNQLNKQALENMVSSKIPYLVILAEEDRVVNNEKSIRELKNFNLNNIKIIDSDHYIPFSAEGIEEIISEIRRNKNEKANN